MKWCWELNRFQHLMCLGGAWRLTGDKRFPAEAREQIDSWIRAIRYPLGVQWASNLEVALRALSWVRCHILFMNSSSWDSAFLDRFAASMYLHGCHIHKELSVHHPRAIICWVRRLPYFVSRCFIPSSRHPLAGNGIQRQSLIAWCRF